MTRLAYGPDHPATLTALLAGAGARFSVTDDTGTLDAEAFRSRVLAVAGGMRSAGVEPGDRVALWLPNGIAYLAAIFACARLGVLAIHINTRFRSVEVGSLLRRSEAIAIVTQWDFAPVDFPAILEGLPPEDRTRLRTIFAAGDAGRPDRVVDLPVRALGGDPVAAGPDEAQPDASCLTYTTSGTTSGPKLVLHDQKTIAGHAQDVARRIGLDRSEAGYLAVVPFCGTFGNAAAMASVAGGAPIVAMPVFDGQAAGRLIRGHRLTHLVGGDDMLEKIVAAAEGRPFEGVVLSGFAAFRSTAAASVAAADALGLEPRGLYGSSEIQALFAFSEGGSRFLGGGVPTSPATELAVRDPETGHDVPPGTSGELWVRTPSRFVEYLGDPAATARAIAPDGFFRTGDLVRREGEGFVFEARIGDTMRLGGFLVSAEEIEAFLQAAPGVAGVQVVAAAPPGGEAAPVAFVQPGDPGLDPDMLMRRCREGLARFKVPARIVIVDAFPIVESPNGPKVQKVRLREMARELLARPAAA